MKFIDFLTTTKCRISIASSQTISSLPDGAACTVFDVLHSWSRGQKNEQQKNAPSPKKQCSCRLSASSKNRAFERCGSTESDENGIFLVSFVGFEKNATHQPTFMERAFCFPGIKTIAQFSAKIHLLVQRSVIFHFPLFVYFVGIKKKNYAITKHNFKIKVHEVLL